MLSLGGQRSEFKSYRGISMKKIILLLLCTMIVILSVGCGSTNAENVNDGSVDSTQSSTDTDSSALIEDVSVEALPDDTEVVKARAKRFAKIDLRLDTEGLAPVADGSDLVALTATLADKEGTPKRYAREKVAFEVEGLAEIVGENPQETRWGEAIVLIRPKAQATPQPITVRAHLVRRGEYAQQNGYLTFTPGSTEVKAGHVTDGDEMRWLRTVEKQQADFNVKEKKGKDK